MVHERLLDDGVTLSDDPTRVDLDAAHAMISRSYWAEGIPRDLLARAIANSVCFGVYAPTGAMVGFARVVTDRATYAYLCDVVIDAAWQGRGLGKRLMEHVLAHPDLQGLRRFALMTRDAHGLYARYGFAPMADPSRYMDINRPGLYRRGT